MHVHCSCALQLLHQGLPRVQPALTMLCFAAATSCRAPAALLLNPALFGSFTWPPWLP
jgi:hypothetical protein